MKKAFTILMLSLFAVGCTDASESKFEKYYTCTETTLKLFDADAVYQAKEKVETCNLEAALPYIKEEYIPLIKEYDASMRGLIDANVGMRNHAKGMWDAFPYGAKNALKQMYGADEAFRRFKAAQISLFN